MIGMMLMKLIDLMVLMMVMMLMKMMMLMMMPVPTLRTAAPTKKFFKDIIAQLVSFLLSNATNDIFVLDVKKDLLKLHLGISCGNINLVFLTVHTNLLVML